jgi:PAS domain S-box-containing protein
MGESRPGDRPAVRPDDTRGDDGATGPICPEDIGIGRLFWRVAEAVVAADVERGRIVLWNPAARRLFGYTAEEAVDQPIELLVPERFREAHRSGLLRYRESGQGRIVDAVHPVAVTARRRSGQEFEVELSLSSIDDRPGGRRLVLAIVRDVSERRRAEAERAQLVQEYAARVAAERLGAELAAVIESIPEAVYVGDWDGIRRANRAALEMLGFASVEELNVRVGLVAERIQSRYPESGQRIPVEDEAFVHALRGETFVREVLVRHVRTGQDRLLRSAAAPIRHGGRIVGAVAVDTDITERRRSEDALRLLADAGAVLAASLDLDATLASVARLAVPRIGDWCAVYLVEGGAIRRVAGSHVDPVKDAYLQQVQRFPLSPSPEHPVRRAIETGRTFVAPGVPPELVDRFATDAEHARLLRALGITMATIVPLVAREQAVGALSFGREGGAPVNRELAEALSARAALAIDNARLYREAQEAVRTRDDFLASASHDLKSPLTAIHGQAELLELRVAACLPPSESAQLTGGLAKIRAVAGRMTAIVNELLDAARLRAGRPLQIEPRPTDLVQLARDMAAEVQDAAARHEIRVEAEAPTLVARCDAFRIERVLGNLLSNAVKYSPDGGPIVVRVRRDGDCALLSVEDRGVGIPPADLPRLFERYHRAGNVTGRIRGAGIGLAGARQIVEQHGGSISVESQEGVGSTFTVKLPLRSV